MNLAKKYTLKLIFVVITSLVFSCVPNKKLVYLQNDDLHQSMPKDSIISYYELDYENYTIQPHDILSVQFQSTTEDEFDFIKEFGTGGMAGGGGAANMLSLRGELVDMEGNIEFPVIGSINVQGLTVFEIQSKLQELVALYVEDPVVKVRLLNYRVSVLGEVQGESVIRTQNTRTTFMEAIALAGGLTEMADRENVKVIRQKGDQAEVFYINLLQEEFLESDKFYIYQNDIVIVPPLRQRPFRRYYAQNLSLLLSSISAVLFIGSLIASNQKIF